MAQQTAVEWLVQELELEGYPFIIKQAKQMEKEQIIIAYSSDRFPCSDDDAEQYYKENYNK